MDKRIKKCLLMFSNNQIDTKLIIEFECHK